MILSALDDILNRITNTDTTSYSDDDKHVDLTRATHLMVSEIIKSQGSWDFQGEIATADLVANQREYIFPTDILKIKKIELKIDGSNWTKAQIIDVSEIGTPVGSESDITNNFDSTQPKVELFDTGYRIYSGTISAVTKGIKIWYSEENVGVDDSGADITSFSTDTDKPNINEAFQMGLVYGAGKIYAQQYELWEKVKAFNIESETYIRRAKEWYGNRAPDTPITVAGASNFSNYD